MYESLETRLDAAHKRDRTKLQTAYDCLRLSSGDVCAAKAYAAGLRVSISARTWAKAIDYRRMIQPTPQLS